MSFRFDVGKHSPHITPYLQIQPGLWLGHSKNVKIYLETAILETESRCEQISGYMVRLRIMIAAFKVVCKAETFLKNHTG